jgi:hypothetical protein
MLDDQAAQYRETVMEGDVGHALRVVESEGRPSLALELPENTSFDEWVSVGRRLCLGQQALNWHIGDWWAFGDHRYGDRAKVAAEGLFGREFQTLANLATVSRAFESSRRGEVLSWTHHREVAALPAEEADSLLARAEREHLSTRDLRREVQAIKAANDPQARPGEVEHRARTVPPQSATAELAKAYEIVIEFAEALQQLRPLTRRESDLFSTALTFVGEAHADHRPCPPDFEVRFVEHGRLAMEEDYGASRVTVNRWLIECGKSRLINARAEYVRFQREQETARPEKVHPIGAAPVDQTLYPVAREAASFLRVSRYGGWTITAAEDGTWIVGTVRRTSDELIAMAERQGFDSEAARREVDAE